MTINKLYIYTISRDLGFAPNPFYGICTLATCKPDIRKDAKVGDWIMGIGGKDLGVHHGNCIYIMQISKKISFQEYWENSDFLLKKPVRNGSKVSLLGDNIYHLDGSGNWVQEDSHHSNADGSTNFNNLDRDTTKSNEVIISDKFIYFGSSSVEIDLKSLGVKSGLRRYKKNLLNEGSASLKLIRSLLNSYNSLLNTIVGDPVMFKDAASRVDQKTNRMI